MLIVTDGQSQTYDCMYPCSTRRVAAAAQAARTAGISVGVLSVGSPDNFNPQVRHWAAAVAWVRTRDAPDRNVNLRPDAASHTAP